MMKSISINDKNSKREDIINKLTKQQNNSNQLNTDESITQRDTDQIVNPEREPDNIKNKIERIDSSKNDSLYEMQNKIKNGDVGKSEAENIKAGFNIKEISLSIFLNYSKFSKEEYQFLLHYQSLVKILKAANIMDDKNNKKTLLKMQEYDLLYKKVNQNSKNINVNQFNNFLVLLANKLFKKEFEIDPKICIFNFIMEFFNPLNDLIQQEVSENPESEAFIHQSTLNKFSEIRFDNQIIFIINSVLPGLKTLYINFFEMENSKLLDVEKIYRDSLSSIIKFCQVYEIMPYIISLDKLAIYFNLINRMNIEDITNNSEINFIFDQKKELGTLFTLSKFICLLYHFSVFCFDKYSSYLKNSEQSCGLNSQLGLKIENLGNAEKFILFLEKIQSLEYKMSSKYKPNFRNLNVLKFNIIPPKDIISSVSDIKYEKS